ncbi:MAG: ATP-binding protein [Thermodesulfobacteriota bacterium]
MRTENEIQYLMKAIDAFKRRLIVISPDFEILAANKPISELTDDEPVGDYCYELFYDRSSPCDNCAVREALADKRPSIHPKPESLAQHGLMPCYYAYPIYNGEEIEAFVSMDFDIPTIDLLEEKLQRSNAFLEKLLQSAVDCVVAADMTGKIFLFNESAVELFGYSLKEALSDLNVRDIYPGDGAYEVMKAMRGSSYGGKGRLITYHTDARVKGGEQIPISLYASVIYEDGEEIASIGFFHDLRDRIRIRKELENTQVQLLQAEKMGSLGKLAAGVAHQINNPLGGITLFSKLILEEYELEDGLKSDVERILRDADRCRKIVKELLEFTRQTRHLMRPNDLNRALKRTLFLLESQALFQNIKVKQDLAEDLPQAVSDVQQMYHLFMNLILNAVQAMDGKGTLHLKTTANPAKNQVQIEISDTGPGILEKDLPYLFEPFFTTKEEGKGTGLGLSLAYNIVENHGGSISAENNPDRGAKFIIKLPIAHKQKQGDERGE